MTTASRLRAAWPALLLVVLVCVAYWPGRNGGFALDDQQNITRNPALQAVQGFDVAAIATATMAAPSSGMARPLSMLSFALNQAGTGADPTPMKLTNIALHAFNALLVLWLVRRLLAWWPDIEARRREWAARFAAAAWALHPIQATAVLYVVQRMEALSHTFVFAGLLLYVLGRERQRDGVRGGGALVALGLLGGTGLGMLAKESAVLLPLYALCLEICVLRFRTRDGVLRGLATGYGVFMGLATLVAAFWLWPRVASGYAVRDFTVVERLLTEPRVLFDYLRWMLLPDPKVLGLFHDDLAVSQGVLQPATTLLAIVGVLALAGLAWWLRGRRPLSSLGIAWFLAAHVLTASFVPLELVYEHRNYFAALGVCLVLADLLLLAPRAEGARRIGALVASLAIVGYFGITLLRANEWRDPYRFATTEAAKRPASPRAQYEFARMVIDLTGYRADSPLLPEAWRALENARAVPGSDTLPHQAALILASLTGTLDGRDAWWRDMEARLRTQPLDSQNLSAVVNLGDCAANDLCHFPPQAMLGVYQAALSHGPHATILAGYGKYALHVLDDTALAERLWTDAVAADPGNAQFRYNLARLHLLMGDAAAARAQRDELHRRGAVANRGLVADLDARLQGSIR